MAIDINLKDIQSGFLSATSQNANNNAIVDAFDKTLNRTSNSGSNGMEVDLDMGLNNLLNVQDLSVKGSFSLQGNSIQGQIDAAVDSATVEAEGYRDEAKLWANEEEDTIVNSGEYSAKHYSLKSEGFKDQAESARDDAEQALFDINSKYYGQFGSDPSTDPNGNSPTEGDFYWNDSTNELRVYTSGSWEVMTTPQQFQAATQAQAEGGTNDNTYMTPLKNQQHYDFNRDKYGNFLSDSDVGVGEAGKVWFKSADTGKLLWQTGTPPSVVNAITVDNSGYIYCEGSSKGVDKLDPSDGSKMWSHSLHSKDILTISESNGVVYSVATYSEIVAADSSDGSEIWTVSDSYTREAMSSDSNGVYYRSDDVIKALSPSDGTELWSHSLHSSFPQAIGVRNSLVVSGATDGEVVACNASDGSEVWTITDYFQNVKDVVLSDSLVFIAHSNGYIRALDPSDGTEVWGTNYHLYESVEALAVDGEYLISVRDSGNIVTHKAASLMAVWDSGPTTDGLSLGNYSVAAKDGVSYVGTDNVGVVAIVSETPSQYVSDGLSWTDVTDFQGTASKTNSNQNTNTDSRVSFKSIYDTPEVEAERVLTGTSNGDFDSEKVGIWEELVSLDGDFDVANSDRIRVTRVGNTVTINTNIVYQNTAGSTCASNDNMLPVPYRPLNDATAVVAVSGSGLDTVTVEDSGKFVVNHWDWSGNGRDASIVSNLSITYAVNF